MAKTKNIAELASISANSASILGKSSGNSVGYLTGLLDDQGKIAGLSEIQAQIAALEELKTQFESLSGNITELQETVGGFEETTNSAITKAFNDRTTIKGATGTAYMNNESNGGLMKFTKTTGEMAKVTLFDGSDGEQTYIQMIAHNADKSKASRLHFTTEGAYYTTATSGTVATADNELVTKKDIKDLSSEPSVQITIDQTYNAESENAQSGTAVAEAVKDLATKTELTAHTGNSEIHVTAEKTAEWDAKVDTAALEAAKTELQGAIDAKVESVMHYKGQVATEGELPGADQVTGDVYNVEETGANYAWNGQSWDKLSEDVSGFASKSELTAHTSDSKIHITDEERTKWNAKLDADAIADMATKTELAEKAAQSDLDTLDNRVDALEAKPDVVVDQTYNAASENAQSGKAVAEAIQKQRVIENEGNTAYMSNETTGGIIKFTKSTGEGGKITAYDGSDSDGTYAQISAFNQDKSQVAKLNFTLTGAYYSKASSGAVAVADNELVTKKDIQDIASNSTVTDLSDRVTALEEKPETTVDQTYSAESENAQSGKAVKEGLDAFKTEIQGIIDAKVESVMHYKGQVATEGELPGADQVTGDVYNVEETGANYAWNGQSWDKLSEDTAGAEALQEHIADTNVHITAELKSKLENLYDKDTIDSKLATKGEKLDYDSIQSTVSEAKQTSENAMNELGTHEADSNLHFSGVEKSEWQTKIESIDSLTSQLTQLSQKLTELEEKVTALQGS